MTNQDLGPSVCSFDVTTPSKAGGFENLFWVLTASITVRSDYRIYSGQIVDIVEVDAESHSIKVKPSASSKADSCLVIISNNIPVSSDADYEITYRNCESLFDFSVDDAINKFYLIAAVAPLVGFSSVYGRDHSNNDRFGFDLSFFSKSGLIGVTDA